MSLYDGLSMPISDETKQKIEEEEYRTHLRKQMASDSSGTAGAANSGDVDNEKYYDGCFARAYTILGGLCVIVFSIGLFALAWHQNQVPDPTMEILPEIFDPYGVHQIDPANNEMAVRLLGLDEIPPDEKKRLAKLMGLQSPREELGYGEGWIYLAYGLSGFFLLWGIAAVSQRPTFGNIFVATLGYLSALALIFLMIFAAWMYHMVRYGCTTPIS